MKVILPNGAVRRTWRPLRLIWALAGAAAVVAPLTAAASGDPKGPERAQVETVATSRSWVSPCWGYNAPKVVRNGKGEVWALNFFGRYPRASAQVFKRRAGGGWTPGKVFPGNYQPAMIFLDHEGRLNLIQNSETEPVQHFRSTDDENLNNFRLVASGNGLKDGRGWYLGVGVRGATVYLSYITLGYDLYLTWKGVKDAAWHKPVLLNHGEVNQVSGNKSWLYPRFYFHGGRGYIAVSGTADGSVHNTYDKIHLVTFPPRNPERFESEEVYEGPAGYYTYCYDMVVAPDGTVACGFTTGEHKYGPEQASALPPGLYVAVKSPGARRWGVHQVDDHRGTISLDYSAAGELYTLVTRGWWDEENECLLKRSSDHGRTWRVVSDDIFSGRRDVKHPFYLQTAHAQSGSAAGNLILGLLTNMRGSEPVDGLYTFDLLQIQIPMR
jgi:hypothetical protein